MADVRITQYPQKIVVADDDIFLIADSNDVDVNGFLKYKKVKAKDLPSIVNTAENITYANLMALKAANGLIISTFYRITDSTSGVSPLLVQAVGVNAISYQAFDGANPLNTINYDVTTDTIRWNLNESLAPLTSVGLSMPSAFSVANSPLTANGTLAVTGAGVVSQYVRGDGTLASFPSSTGGGSSVSYYFNGGTSQGVIGGNTYYEMSKTAIIGVGADFNINANGYIAQFVTDANDPSLLNIPAGNWNFEMWFSASSGGGSPSFYLELYKYDGATLTLISSGSATPESITGGTAIDLYTTALAVPSTALTITDRLAVRVFVNNSGRTITLHTQNGHLCQAITTFSTGLTALNGLTNQVQYLTTGTSGTDFGISSATSTHTFNLPTASATNRGALSSADWTTFNNKQNALTNPITGTGTTNYLPKFTGTSALGNSQIFDNGTSVGIGTITPAFKLESVANGSSNANNVLTGSAFAVGRTADLQALGIRLKTDAGISGTFPLQIIANGNNINALEIYTTTNKPIVIGTDTTERFRFDTSGNFGWGTSASFAKFYANGTRTTIDRHAFEDFSILNTTDTNLGYSSFDSKATLNNSLAQDHFISYQARNIYTGSGNLTNRFVGFHSFPVHNGTGTITNLYGAKFDDITGTGTVINNYGVWVGEMSKGTTIIGLRSGVSSGTGKWNLFMGGTAANHLQGNLLIGGSALPLNRKISIEGNITGAATSYGIDQFVTISSDVTTSMFGYRSNPSTAAAAFTLPDLYHFYANDAGIGAGSAVTRQYGFYSSIASGTGKWGVYMAGTADNYMNGNLGLGVSPSAWSGFGALQTIGGSVIGAAGQLDFWQNAYFDGASKYYATGTATRYGMTAGQHRWFNAVSGSANAALTWVQAMTLDASGNLGVGATTITNPIHIRKFANSYLLDGLKVDRDPGSPISAIFNAFGGGANIIANSGTTSTFGTITFRTSDNTTVTEMGRFVGATGNFLIGTTTDAGYKLDVNGTARITGKLTVDNNSGISILASANFGMNMYFDSATGYSYIDSKYDSAGAGRLYIRTRTNGTPVNALMFLGTGDATFASGASVGTGLALNGGTIPASGIQFPATQVASANNNNLDDYEEGTWTMGVSFGGGTTGITYSSNTGQYTKVGRKVTVTGYLLLTNKGTSTGTAVVTGLPFTVGNLTSFLGASSIYFGSITFSGTYSGLAINNTTNITLNQVTTLGVSSVITDANFANNSGIIVTLTYFV